MENFSEITQEKLDKGVSEYINYSIREITNPFSDCYKTVMPAEKVDDILSDFEFEMQKRRLDLSKKLLRISQNNTSQKEKFELEISRVMDLMLEYVENKVSEATQIDIGYSYEEFNPRVMLPGYADVQDRIQVMEDKIDEEQMKIDIVDKSQIELTGDSHLLN